MIAFVPEPGATVNINVGSTSAEVQVTATQAPQQIRVYNDGSATVWIQFGTTSSVAATTSTGTPIPAGDIEVFTPPIGPVYVAAIAAAATGKIYFTPGNGI